MSNVIRTIFGGGESKTVSSSIPSDFTPQEFKNLRPAFSDTLLSLINSGGTPDYTGKLFEPLSSTEEGVLKFLNDNTGSGSAARGVLDDTLSGRYLPGQDKANPFLDAAIRAAQRPTLEGLEEVLSRALPGRFTQAGHLVQSNAPAGQGGSSAFDRAAAIATRGAANTLGDIATNISAGAFENERNRQQQAVQLNQQEVDTTIKNLQAQALPRLIQENGIDRALQLFQQKTASLLQLLQTIGGVTAPTIANTQNSTTTAKQSNGILAPFKIAFGGGGSAPTG